MTEDDWKILEHAFSEAVAIFGDQRAAYVDAFRVEHPGLADRLERLLAADASSDEHIEDVIADTAASMTGESNDPWIGRDIGPWRIVRRIAVGGMGAVFLAERSDEQYEQSVALKVMTAQLLSADALSRFRAERQILASLRHPNIATLIDGGSTDEKLPYLVMEYVDGEPIDEYCDREQLDIRSRLRVFRKVCAAVDFAHRNLVVHRDLKPSNILVDSAGEPHLLDFGIAKLLDAGSYRMTQAITRDGTRALTPSYASPEHVRGQPVSIASDVYSLGVLLYRLLTGHSPYGDALESRRSIELAILETEPRRPSTVVTKTDGAATRTISPDRLCRVLAGDLDNIVLKALQKDPERRYPTAADLSEDIGNYLGNRPVVARPDSFSYRAGKFVRRNTVPLAVAFAFVATVAGLTTYYTLELAAERDRAQLQATRSDEIASFLTSLFENASPHRSKGEPVTAVDLLEQGRERIETLGDQPDLQADLMRVMASNMTALGDRERAIPMLERVLEIRESLVPRDEVSISQTTHNLAEATRQIGRLEEAERYERRTLQIATDAFGPDNSDVGFVTMRLGVILFDAGRMAEAIELEERGLAIMMANGDGESSMAIDARGNLANSYAREGRYADAEALHRETLELSRRIDGELAPNTLIRASNLARVLNRTGKLDEAESLLEKVIEDARQVWPPEHDLHGSFKELLCSTKSRLGRFEDALVACREGLDNAAEVMGTESRDYERRLRSLGSTLLGAGRTDEAVATFTEVLALALSIEGEDSNDAAIVRIQLGRAARQQGRLDVAEENLRLAIARGDAMGRAEHLAAMKELGLVLSEQGRYDEAAALIEEAVAGQGEAMGADGSSMLPMLQAAAEHYRRVGDTDSALARGERIAAIIGQDDQPLRWEGALALAEYGRVLNELGRAEARAVLARAHGVLQESFGAADPRVAEIAALL